MEGIVPMPLGKSTGFLPINSCGHLHQLGDHLTTQPNKRNQETANFKALFYPTSGIALIANVINTAARRFSFSSSFGSFININIAS
jgi:hypothetical protein